MEAIRDLSGQSGAGRYGAQLRVPRSKGTSDPGHRIAGLDQAGGHGAGPGDAGRLRARLHRGAAAEFGGGLWRDRGGDLRHHHPEFRGGTGIAAGFRAVF